MKRNKLIAANEISEIIAVDLNGYEQKIVMEGKRKDLSIVIALHGG